MKKVSRSELLDLGAYEQIRQQLLNRVIAAKKTRRVAVGEHMTFVFENHDTMLFQIHEMLRTERITSESGIAHELEMYNEIVPGEGELVATLFVEYDDKEERARMLVALVGLGEHVSLRIGDRVVRAQFLVQPGEEQERLPAVCYARFRPGVEAERALRDESVAVTIEITHPEYRATATVAAATRGELAGDLVG